MHGFRSDAAPAIRAGLTLLLMFLIIAAQALAQAPAGQLPASPATSDGPRRFPLDSPPPDQGAPSFTPTAYPTPSLPPGPELTPPLLSAPQNLATPAPPTLGPDAPDAISPGTLAPPDQPLKPKLPGAGPRVLVTDVKIVGNESTKQHVIEAQLKTRKDREFDPEFVQADVRRLASTGRFYDVKSFTQNTPQGVAVTFQVFERPTIRYVKYLGNRAISDKALAKQDQLKVGEPLNRYSVEEARRKLEEHYQSKGYTKAQVTVLEGDKPTDKGAVFMVNEGFLERISEVRFVGNAIATDQRLKTQVKSKPGFMYLIGGKVDRKKLDEDIEHLTAYYRNLGFFNARIGRELEFGESGKWLTITFVIDEGQRYVVRNVSLVGNDKFSAQELMEKLELKPGEYFNQSKMNHDMGALTDAYGGQGHIFADIKADPRFLEEPGQLDLVYKIQEGGVWHAGRVNVHIAGEYPHTRESVILNRMSVVPGEVIDIREVRASERRLKGSQLFENDPSKGDALRVVVRPPELQNSVGNVAQGESSSKRGYRGQSPSAVR
jgi:outer membrane protein insertion porin family